MLDINEIENNIIGNSNKFVDYALPGLGVKSKILGDKAVSVSEIPKVIEGLEKKVNDSKNAWYGVSKAEAISHYKKLKALGIQHKEFYFIRFRPYSNDVKSIPMLANESIGFLATDVSWSYLQVDSESKKVGNFTMNYATGRQAPEINLTMIETANNDILKSVAAMRKIMFPDDGTYGLPSKYSVWVELHLFNKKWGIADPTATIRMLGYLSQTSLELSSTDTGALTIPLTFVSSRPFML